MLLLEDELYGFLGEWTDRWVAVLLDPDSELVEVGGACVGHRLVHELG